MKLQGGKYSDLQSSCIRSKLWWCDMIGYFKDNSQSYCTNHIALSQIPVRILQITVAIAYGTKLFA